MPEDYEEFFSLTLRKRNSKKPLRMLARNLMETPMAPAVPCKTSKTCKHGKTRGKTNEIKSKLACILEASEFTRLRGHGHGVLKACAEQAAADSQGSRTSVCANTFLWEWHMQEEKDELTSCRGTV